VILPGVIRCRDIIARAELVYVETKKRAKDAVLMLVEKEREGELVDRALAKNILGIYIELGMGTMDCYEKDFEEHLLADTSAFYRRKASEWIEQVCARARRLSVGGAVGNTTRLARPQEIVSLYLGPTAVSPAFDTLNLAAVPPTCITPLGA
jgi:hypothetical protein